MPLKTTMGLLKGAYEAFMSGRAISALLERHEVEGFITATEVTYGGNGWHPHLHALVFVRWGGDLWMMPEPEQIRYKSERGAELHLDFWLRWRDQVEKAGFEPSPEAFDVRCTDDQVVDYVAKFGRLPSEERRRGMTWGPVDELTKAVVKRARGESRAPFQLLADSARGDVQAGQLFKEYAEATKGLRQLRYSKGLREKLGLGREKQIDELVNEDDEVASTLAWLDANQWAVVLRNDQRAEVLAAARRGKDELFAFLDRLPGMDETRPFYDEPVGE